MRPLRLLLGRGEVLTERIALLSIRVCRDAVTRRSLGYAYVNYLNASDGSWRQAMTGIPYSQSVQVNVLWSS